MRRRQAEDWPTAALTIEAYREFIYELATRRVWEVRGGMPVYRLLDRGLLESALAAPFQTAGGVAVYPTVPGKAACLLRGLIKNHPLADGNKRAAVVALVVFLTLNGWQSNFTNTGLYRYALRVARHEGNYRVATIERWIRRHAVLMADEDLVILRSQIEAADRPPRSRRSRSRARAPRTPRPAKLDAAPSGRAGFTDRLP